MSRAGGASFTACRHRWAVLAALLAGLGVGLVAWLLSYLHAKEVDHTWQRIQETGVLRVCTDPSWPPFESWGAAGQVVGLDAELAELLAARLAPNGRAAMVVVGFDSLYDALLADRCDAILSALPYDPSLTEDVAYSAAYFNSGLVLVANERSAGVNALEDLAGHVIGVEWGFVLEGNPRQRLLLGDLQLRRYDTAWDVLRAVQSGEVEAALVDRTSALAYLRECQGIRLVGEPITDVNYVIPVRPDSVRLLREINRVLLNLEGDGTLEGLERKWF